MRFTENVATKGLYDKLYAKTSNCCLFDRCYENKESMLNRSFNGVVKNKVAGQEECSFSLGKAQEHFGYFGDSRHCSIVAADKKMILIDTQRIVRYEAPIFNVRAGKGSSS